MDYDEAKKQVIIPSSTKMQYEFNGGHPQAETMMQRKGIISNGVYSLDPYLGPRSGTTEEEVARMKKDLKDLRMENGTLKARLRGEHNLNGGYPGGNLGRGNGGRGGGRGSYSGSRGNYTGGKSFAVMTAAEKQAVTCAAWNATATPGAAGGCNNPVTGDFCEKDGVRMRHGCSTIKAGGTHVCWDRRHTTIGHI